MATTNSYSRFCLATDLTPNFIIILYVWHMPLLSRLSFSRAIRKTFTREYRRYMCEFVWFFARFSGLARAKNRWLHWVQV